MLLLLVFPKGIVAGGPGGGGAAADGTSPRAEGGRTVPDRRERPREYREHRRGSLPAASGSYWAAPVGIGLAGPQPLPGGCKMHRSCPACGERGPPASAALRRLSHRGSAALNAELRRHGRPCPGERAPSLSAPVPSPLPLPAAQSEQTRPRLPVQHLRNTFYLHGISSGHCTLYTDISPLQQGRSCARLVASSGAYPTVHGKCPPHLEVSAVRVQVTFPVLLSLLRRRFRHLIPLLCVF